jgi:hypothetical protein
MSDQFVFFNAESHWESPELRTKVARYTLLSADIFEQ